VSERTGFYLSVLKEGEVEAGSDVQLLERNASGITVFEVARLYSSDKNNVDLLRKALATPRLPEDWREYLQERIQKLTR
jgi:MOSC domain-containing protein YiiM